MGLRFNPPPNWPPPPPGFVPPPRWQPDPDWPPPPPGWQLWVPDDAGPGRPGDFPGGAAGVPPRPPEFAAGPAGAATQVTGPARPPWHDDFATGAGEFLPGPGGFQGGPGDLQGGPGGFQGGPGDLQGGPGGFQGGPPAPSGQTNGFAVAAFVLGLLGIGTVLSYVFGVVALRQIRVSGQRGRGLAIAGLALSAMWTLLVIAFVLLNSKTPPAKTPVAGGSTPTASSSSPAPSPVPSGSAGTANVFSLVTGECFQNPPASQTVLGITYVTVTPCTKRHNAQVFVEFPATGTRYPGSAALQREADQGCHKRVSRTIVKSKITPTMTLRYLYPLAGSWAQGHRTISCLIVDAKPDLKTSLLRHAPKH